VYRKIIIYKIIMEKCLIIVESPSKVRLIEKYLGSNYNVIASNGHICNIENLKDINVKGDFETKYRIIDSKKSLVSKMRMTITEYNFMNIYLGTDDDVEGEKIAYDICIVFGLPVDKTPRIKFNEITEIALKNSIKNSSLVNMNIVKSQQARQILDMLIGFKISPILWKYIHNSKSETLSAGRCQSSALSLIYDNEQSLKRKTISKNYKTTGRFLDQSFSVELILSVNMVEESAVRDFLELSINHNHVVSLSKSFMTTRNAPQPFNTSRLIQVSSTQNNNSPKTTMKLAQQLYQDGLITYMRTESNKYSQDFLVKAGKYISLKYGNDFVGNNELISNIISRLPHEAIRVTDLKILKIDGEPKLKGLYSLIYKNTIESCMSIATFNSYNINISAPLDNLYTKQIDVPLFNGWTQHKGVSIEPNYHKYIECLSNKVVKYQEIKSILTVGASESHYSEAGIIKKLEEFGIGRPSTLSSFIEINMERGYIKKENIEGLKIKCIDFWLKNSVIKEDEKEREFCGEKNKLVIQETGVLSIEFLKTYYSELFDYSYTKEMEIRLDKIKDDSVFWNEICKETYNNINEQTKRIKINEKSDYILDEFNTLKFLRYGPVVEHKNDINGEIEFLPIKQNIVLDIEKLKRNEYSMVELVEYKNSFIGIYEGEPVYIKIGKFGLYVEHNSKNYKVPNSIVDITMDNAVEIMNSDEKMKNVSTAISRFVNNDISVRNGKNGKPYIFYKTKKMKKPIFISVDKSDILTCQMKDIIDIVDLRKK
jgi:DNA topoisomerase-1